MNIGPIHQRGVPAVPRPGRPRRAGSGRSRHERDPWQQDGLTAEDVALLAQAGVENDDAQWGSQMARTIAAQRLMGAIVGRLNSINVRSLLGTMTFDTTAEQQQWDQDYARLLAVLDAQEAVSGPARLDIRA